MGTNYQRLHSLFEDKMAHLKREKVSLSEAFRAVYRPGVTLQELCSCGNLSENRIYFDKISLILS